MIIYSQRVDDVKKKAAESPRLRANFCLHKSPDDKVQKMINILLPGTEMPIHCHHNSDETLVVLKGKITIVYFDNEGVETERYLLNHSMPAIDIPMNQWHNIIVKEPAALLEIKEGPYRPLSSEEVKM